MKKAIRKNIVLWTAIIVMTTAGPGFAQEKQSVKVPVEVSGIANAQLPAFVQWIDANGVDPMAYAIAKCQKHQLVVFGESHNKKEQVEFFKKVAIEAYHKAGVRVVALECCNVEDNEKIARLVNGAEYDIKLAYEIARADDWGLWGYQEYWDIFKAVWELNRSLPAGREPMTVIGIDKAVDLQLWTLWKAKRLKDPALIEKVKNQPNVFDRDDWLMAHIEKEVLNKGRKGILLIGFNHSFTHYSQSDYDNKTKEMTATWDRMGVLLYRKYGDKIFQIGFHVEQGPSLMLREGDKGGAPVFTSFLESVMAARGSKPTAFDVPDSPFAPLRDSRSELFYWQPKVTFADICRGYVFQKPFKALAPCGWMKDYISDAMFEKSRVYYEYAYKIKFKDAREVNGFFSSGKPQI